MANNLSIQKDAQRLQKILHLAEKSIDSSTYFFSSPKRIKKSYKSLLHRQNLHAQGEFKGLVFENYLTYVLIQATRASKMLDLYVPLQKPKSVSPINDGWAHDENGQILFKRQGYPVMELDGIVQIEGRLYALEFKSHIRRNKLLEKKQFRRLVHLRSIFDDKIGYLLCVPQSILPDTTEFTMNTMLGNETIPIIHTSLFDSHFKFSSTQFQSIIKRPTRLYAKKSLLPKIAPTVQNFLAKEQSTILNFGNARLPGATFLMTMWDDMAYVAKLPIGIFASDDYIQQFFSPNTKGVSMLKKMPVVITLCADFFSLRLSITFYDSVRKLPYDSKYSMDYNETTRVFQDIHASLGEFGFQYHNIGEYLKLNPPVIDVKTFEMLAQRVKNINSQGNHLNFSDHKVRELANFSRHNAAIYHVLATQMQQYKAVKRPKKWFRIPQRKWSPES